MTNVFKAGLWILSLLSASHAVFAAENSVSLDGAWYFALDPVHRGEALGWQNPPEDWDRGKPLTPHGWDEVNVPHCWSTDPRYADIQRVWYRRAFTLPASADPVVYRLQFGAVFHTCRVWINGQPAGGHAGGYLPFDLDITPFVTPGEANFIAVEVDNSWDLHTLPGARPGDDPSHQLYPWWNWGGLLRSVRVAVDAPVYVRNQRIVPTLAAGGAATIDIHASVCNRAAQTHTVRLTADIADAHGATVARSAPLDIEVAANSERTAQLQATIPAGDVHRWDLDHPNLYTATLRVTEPAGAAPRSQRSDTFGIRTLTVRDAEFLLNDEPVRLAGANRVLDHPDYGGLEPDELVELDLRLLKDAHLELARLQHYPCSPAVLDWADRHGLLIVAEAASWGFPEEHLADPAVRERFRAQIREMIEAQWNHPCIVAWSVGNEYVSWSPEGVSWTKDMKAFVRELDDTRPVVFVGLGGVMKHDELPREQRSLHYSDILCINCYMNEGEMATLLDRVHAVWPDRPILITEYGKRFDRVEDERQRVEHFHNVLALVRQRPFICGLSYWTFNDYRSRYPGTNPSGYRPWGIVDPLRNPRAVYAAMKSALAPATLDVRREGDALRVRVTVGTTFSAYALRDCSVRLIDANGQTLAESPLPDVGLGGTQTVVLPDAPSTPSASVVLVRPTGFVAASAPLPAE